MSKPTTDKCDEMQTLANGIRPSLIHTPVTADSPSIHQPLGISSTETPLTDGVCKLRHILFTVLNRSAQSLGP